MSKKIFSFDEVRDAEKILLNGFPNGVIDYHDMYVIAKYFRETYGYGRINLEKKLIQFCLQQDNNFNPVLDAGLIQKWVNSAMNYSLRKIENVTISQKEIDFLKTISVIKDRKLLFVTLIFAKAMKKRSTKKRKEPLKTSDNYYIHYNNFSDIIKLSKLKGITEIELACVFNTYKEHFYFYKPEKELIRLEFVDKYPETHISINKLESPMEYYELLFSENKELFFCIDCGNKIEKNSNSHERCKTCSGKRRREKQKEIMRKRRNVSK